MTTGFCTITGTKVDLLSLVRSYIHVYMHISLYFALIAKHLLISPEQPAGFLVLHEVSHSL